MHPLYIARAALGSTAGVTGLRFKITRKTNAFKEYPTTGQEVQIKIRVELLTDSSFYSLLTSSTFYTEATLVLFPRELAYFTLITPRNLHLDGKDSSVNGDVSIASASSAPASQGLVFDSPVYVHGDIILPAHDSTEYTPVKFLAPAVLGAGAMGAQPKDRYFGTQNGFGGFNKGVRPDGAIDFGFPCLFGINGPPNSADPLGQPFHSKHLTFPTKAQTPYRITISHTTSRETVKHAKRPHFLAPTLPFLIVLPIKHATLGTLAPSIQMRRSKHGK